MTQPATTGSIRRSTRVDWFRWVLLVAWVVLALTVLVTGERKTPLSDLEDDLAAGKVTQVVVRGDGLNGGDGWTTQEILWRDGLIDRVTIVVSSRNATSSGALKDADQLGAQDAGPYLQERYPDLSVSQGAEITSGSEFLGWVNVPVWVGVSLLVVNFGALLLLIGSTQQPWRATRWAWFWVWTTLIGAPLYLLLSGPTPPLPTPRRGAWRLTGGWAFILCVLILGSLSH